MKIYTFNKNSMGQNVYLYHCEVTNQGVIIDAGINQTDENALMEVILEKAINIKGILITHGHYDHLIGAEKLHNLLHAPIYCHGQDAPFLQDPGLNLSNRIAGKIAITPHHTFNDGDVFTFGHCNLKVIHTPGHTPGGVCYYHPEGGNLFTGDTLFNGTIGRTDLPQGNHDQLIKNIKAKLKPLPDATVIYPGHGGHSTIGNEKRINQFF